MIRASRKAKTKKGMYCTFVFVNDICAHEDWVAALMAAAVPDVKEKLPTRYQARQHGHTESIMAAQNGQPGSGRIADVAEIERW